MKLRSLDETERNRMGPDGKTFVRRPKGQALNPKYTIKSIKHGGGRILCWGAFSWHGVGPIIRINEIMDRFQYLDILKNIMDLYVFENLPVTGGENKSFGLASTKSRPESENVCNSSRSIHLWYHKLVSPKEWKNVFDSSGHTENIDEKQEPYPELLSIIYYILFSVL